MTDKEKKELYKQFNVELCELCKEGNDEGRIRYLISVGADIFYAGLKPLSCAVRKKNFNIIDLLIDQGILKDERAIRIIASVCDHKNFDEEAEQRFFELLDRAIAITGTSFDYFVPYINSMIVHGKMNRLYSFLERYSLTRREAANAVYPRLIFETINNGFYNSLLFINENIDWMTEANLETATSSGETDVIKYIFDNSKLGLPSENAILAAIFEGSTEILELLVEKGWNAKNNPLYLKKACRSFYSNGEGALMFLLDNGYSLTDCYDGKTIYENAVFDNNTPLLEFLKSRGINS